MAAYDYERQTWIEGVEADTLRRAQMAEELALIEGPRGQTYLDSMRRKGEPRRLAAHVAQAIREEMSR